MSSLNANEKYLQLHVSHCHLYHLLFPFFSLLFHAEKQTLESMINGHFANEETDVHSAQRAKVGVLTLNFFYSTILSLRGKISEFWMCSLYQEGTQNILSQ